jgi:peptidoglycan/xylan/chitin deacetylase (PgdA/CDA1 family)
MLAVADPAGMWLALAGLAAAEMNDSSLAHPGTLRSLARTSALSVALGSGVSQWLAQRHPVRRILMLHGVGGERLRQEQFARMVSWLRRRYAIVSLDAMVRDIQAGVPPPAGVGRSQLAITFDDGLRNQCRLARPVLERLGVPATIFVCPGLVETGQWMWNHDVRARLRRLRPEVFAEWARQVGAPSRDGEGAILWMKTLPLPQRERAHALLRECTPRFVPTAQERAAYDVMDWDEVRACDQGLLRIGSHTMTHPILPTLDDDAIRRELHDSRALLEARLGRTVDLFCYPNGACDARVYRIARTLYRAAVTTEEGVIDDQVDPLAIPRIPATAHLPLLAWRMHHPWA